MSIGYIITLKKIDEHNRAECESLQVSKDQSQYIASNADSLKEAAENAQVARKIYDVNCLIK